MIHKSLGFTATLILGVAFAGCQGNKIEDKTQKTPVKIKKQTQKTETVKKKKNNINDVYLLIGQSNMAGRAKYQKGDTFESGRIYVLGKNEKFKKFNKYPWINEYSTIRKSAAQISPGYTFAKTMAKIYPKKHICLVSNARGGSSIEQWAKGTKYYNEAVRRTKEAMKQGQLKAILWHQGETNYENIMRKSGTEKEKKEAMKKYLQNLRQFIKDLRHDLNAENVPFVAGEVNQGYKLLNETLAELPNKKEKIYLVTSENIKTADHVHFDRTGVLELGKRYANEVLKLQNKK